MSSAKDHPNEIDPPGILTVIIGDTWHSTCKLIHEQNSVPIPKRTVQVALTSGQMDALGLRYCGNSSGSPKYEEVLECWLERDPAEVTK